MMELFGAFDLFFALPFALVFKAISSVRDRRAGNLFHLTPIILLSQNSTYTRRMFPMRGRFAKFALNDKGPTNWSGQK